MQEIEFIVRAALAGETNNGWVWICGLSTEGLQSRTVLKIRRAHPRRTIYTELRRIDRNFLRQYNDDEKGLRIDIDRRQDTLVMGEWYRVVLAIDRTTRKDNQGGRVALSVKRARVWGWRAVRAACHHPDLVVRLGTRLGLLGAWLGVLGVWLGMLSVFPTSRLVLRLGLVVLLLGALGAWAGCGPLRLRFR